MSIIENRLKEVSHSIIQSEECISERVLDLGHLCVEANELLSEATKGSSECLKELGKKCIQISALSDKIVYELFISNVITTDDMMKEYLKAVK